MNRKWNPASKAQTTHRRVVRATPAGIRVAALGPAIHVAVPVGRVGADRISRPIISHGCADVELDLERGGVELGGVGRVPDLFACDRKARKEDGNGVRRRGNARRTDTHEGAGKGSELIYPDVPLLGTSAAPSGKLTCRRSDREEGGLEECAHRC